VLSVSREGSELPFADAAAAVVVLAVKMAVAAVKRGRALDNGLMRSKLGLLSLLWSLSLSLPALLVLRVL
jgi:hypothetical protein